MSSYMGDSAGLYRLDPLDGSVQDRCSPPAASFRGYGGLTFDGTYLWEADSYGGGIYKLRTSDCSVVSEIPSPDESLRGDLAWDGTHLWTAGAPSEKIYRIQPSDGAVVAAFDPPGGTVSVGLAYFGESLWVSQEGQLLQIHPTEWRVMASFAHSIPKPDGLAWDGQHLWIASFSEAMIYVCSMDQ
jgi:hypothetical protein